MCIRDRASGALFVDRFLHTPMRYPANYGFIPHTLGEDGDPLDALVVARSPVVAGAVVKCRPIGVLKMVDDGGGDETVSYTHLDVYKRQPLPLRRPTADRNRWFSRM